MTGLEFKPRAASKALAILSIPAYILYSFSQRIRGVYLLPMPRDAWQVLTEGMDEPIDEQVVYVGTG